MKKFSKESIRNLMTESRRANIIVFSLLMLYMLLCQGVAIAIIAYPFATLLREALGDLVVLDPRFVMGEGVTIYLLMDIFFIVLFIRADCYLLKMVTKLERRLKGD